MEQELQKLGLSEYESKVYTTLLRYGSLRSNEMSKLSKVPQSKIYEVLYKLAEKGFVSILDIKPRQFKAINPKQAIPAFVHVKKDDLEEKEREALNRISEMKTAFKKPKTDELVTIYKGRKASMSIISNRYHAAKKYMKEMFSFEYIPFSLFREMEKTTKRGIHIKLIATKMGEHQMKLIHEAKRCGAKVRYYPIGDFRISIKDGREAVQMIVNPKDLMDRTTIIIESLELTKALEHYFDFVWEKAEKV